MHWILPQSAMEPWCWVRQFADPCVLRARSVSFTFAAPELTPAAHFLFLHVDLRILPLDRRYHRCVFRLSAGPGQRIPRVCSVLNRVAPRLRKDKILLGQFLPLLIRQLCHRDFSRPSCSRPCSPIGWPWSTPSCTRPQDLTFRYWLLVWIVDSSTFSPSSRSGVAA